MPVPILLDLLRSKVESFSPLDALAIAKAAEESEQRAMQLLGHRIEGRKR